MNDNEHIFDKISNIEPLSEDQIDAVRRMTDPEKMNIIDIFNQTIYNANKIIIELCDNGEKRRNSIDKLDNILLETQINTVFNENPTHFVKEKVSKSFLKKLIYRIYKLFGRGQN